MELIKEFKVGDSIKFSHWFFTSNQWVEVKVLYSIVINDEQYVRLGPFPNGVKEKLFKASILLTDRNVFI